MTCNIEISNLIETADKAFRASNFDNMPPRMIAAEMRASGICRALRLIDEAVAEIYETRRAATRMGQSHLGIYDRLNQRARAVWQRYDNAIEAAVQRTA